MAALTMYRGNSAIWDGVAKIDGEEIDLTLYSIWFTVKQRRDNDLTDSSALFKKTVGDGITLKDQSGDDKGGFTMELEPEDTEAVTYAIPYQYDVKVKGADGKPYTTDSGTLTISLDVTRATA